ncbi:MAG TPA: hydrogenase subunit MbhD domain-containing protein [Candidatus Nanoarchaeia archaeon]|nr:hydrogenase subunit MbhD domain-containing protein [Candidatus Nanoarchaeia archaeon]
MIWIIDIVMLFFLVVCAIAAISVKDLLSAVIILSLYSLIMAIVWVEMRAVDVAFTEASVGAGITTVFFIFTLVKTTGRSED